MPPDPVNRLAGRKPLMMILDGSTESYIFDTTELVVAFGITRGMHLVIDLITIGAIAADAGNQINFHFDTERDDSSVPVLETPVGVLTALGRGILIHIINAANTTVAMTSVDVYNTLGILDPSTGTSVIHFFYHLEEGGMDFSQENQEAKIEVRQIEAIQGDPGDQYFQVDPVGHNRQVFIGGVD